MTTIAQEVKQPFRGKVHGDKLIVNWEELGKAIIGGKNKQQTSGILVGVGVDVKNKELAPGMEVVWTMAQIDIMTLKILNLDGGQYISLPENLVQVYRWPEEMVEPVVVDSNVGTAVPTV